MTHQSFWATQKSAQAHESPSLSSADCLDLPPATGLRLPPSRSEPDALHVAPSSAGGEHEQGTSNGRQEATDAREPSGDAAGVPTGLVLEGRMYTDPNGVGWSLRDDECPHEGSIAFDHTTGEVAWRPTCKNARCRRCSRQVSAQTFALARRALEETDRVRFITLTLAPQGWEATRQAVRTWLQHLRRAGYRMHVMWVVEVGDGGMKHVHAIQWGDYVPKEELSSSWPYGFTQIEGARAATNYLAKGVVRYVAKGLDGDGKAIEEHMNLNGGRAAHWSREFFAGHGRNAYRQSNPLPGIYFVHTATAREGVN